MPAVSSNYDSDEFEMATVESYEPMSGENLEKSLTNLNINNAMMASQVTELGIGFQEFCSNFMK